MTSKPPPTVEELLQEVAHPSEDAGPVEPSRQAIETSEARQLVIQRQDEQDALTRQLQYSKLKAFEDHHANKGKWSLFIMWVMAAMLGFQSGLLAMVGWGFWDFSKYEWLLPSLLVQNLAQIIVLATIIVKALFDKHKE